jgi:hypothetical protein
MFMVGEKHFLVCPKSPGCSVQDRSKCPQASLKNVFFVRILA